jgi:nickel-dependent lactate racemase
VEVKLDYGESGLVADLPDPVTVVTPEHRPPLRDPGTELVDALRSPIGAQPLREMAAGKRRVVISVCDITRPQPRPLVLGAVLSELEASAGPREVAVLIATGTHRANTEEELRRMLGNEVVGRARVLNHDSRDPSSLVDLGEVAPGLRAVLNREWVEADLRIATGFVEPHLFAGFSGGPKMIAPGLAGLSTVMVLHDARRIGSPAATWGVIEGNPVQDGLRLVAARAPSHFGLDVTLDRDQEVTGVFAGALIEEHALACEAARRVAMRPVDAPFDVVVTTNSGYPLDQNLYQAVKGMSAAAQVVKAGGLIVCAAECRDGLPDHGSFAELLRSQPSPGALLERIESAGHCVPDQWQAQILARVLEKARVVVKAGSLTPSQLADAHLGATEDVGATVRAEMLRLGPGARLCVLPEGPQTIPFVR